MFGRKGQGLLRRLEIVEIFNPKNFVGSSTYYINHVLNAAERVVSQNSSDKMAA